MSFGINLEQSYQAYLQSIENVDVSLQLCNALSSAGLRAEAAALLSFIEQGGQTVVTIHDGAWCGRRCFVAPRLPLHAQPGDLWLDTREVTLMLLVADSDDLAPKWRSWISTHPVYMWQFRVFLRLVNWRLTQRYFMDAPDLLQLQRFDNADSMAFATDVYHEEAVAYAHWFGKFVCGQLQFQAASASLDRYLLSQLVPSGMRLWQEAEFSSSEFVRVAVDQDTLFDDPDEEFESSISAQDALTVAPARNLLFKEWERSPSIGFSTAVSMQIGLISQLPMKAFEFVEMINVAPRPLEVMID